MDIKGLLKFEDKFLKRCNRMFKNTKVLYWKKGFKEDVIDLTDPANEDMVTRIKLRHHISELNKKINHYLVKRLKDANIDPEPYMKNYWNDITMGFGMTKNKYSRPDSFQKTFLTNQDSQLYRKFTNCLTAPSMQNYILYLSYYLQQLKQFGHKEALKITLAYFQDEENMRAAYQDPAIPDNWAEIYKQLEKLYKRERIYDEENE